MENTSYTVKGKDYYTYVHSFKCHGILPHHDKSKSGRMCPSEEYDLQECCCYQEEPAKVNKMRKEEEGKIN